MVTWKVWATVDGTRVPGTVIQSTPSGTALRNVTLAGVTESVVPAGAHVGALVIDCDGTATTSSTTFTAEDLSIVVLG